MPGSLDTLSAQTGQSRQLAGGCAYSQHRPSSQNASPLGVRRKSIGQVPCGKIASSRSCGRWVSLKILRQENQAKEVSATPPKSLGLNYGSMV
jgi:hypothetical protein